MSKTFATIAMLAPVLLGGCAGFTFEPTANWWRDGGRICAADRDTTGMDWRRDAPRSCAQANAQAAPLGK